MVFVAKSFGSSTGTSDKNRWEEDERKGCKVEVKENSIEAVEKKEQKVSESAINVAKEILMRLCTGKRMQYHRQDGTNPLVKDVHLPFVE